MKGARTCLTPMSTTVDLMSLAPVFSDVTMYRRLEGSLQYLTFTRPDISFVVNCVSQFMQQPAIVHYTTVKRIL